MIVKVIIPEFSGQSIIAHMRLGLFEKRMKCPCKVTFMNKQVVPDIIKKTEVLATHEPYKKIWIKEEMPMDDKITAGKNERGTEQK